MSPRSSIFCPLPTTLWSSQTTLRPSRATAAILRTARVVVAFCLVTLPSQAQSPTNSTSASAGAPALEDSIVVSADLYPVAAASVGSSVTVITEEEIERRGSLTLAELLRTVPGVEITQAGGAGKAASVRIRGGDASHALVLIDGVRVNSPTTGDFDFANLTTDAIERVEVLRGPQAAYGSEAVTGVISITTKRGAPGAHFDVGGEAGSDRLRYLRAAASGRRGGFDYSMSTSGHQTDGVSHRSERLGNTEQDGYDNQTVAGRFGFEIDDEGRLELIVRAFDGKTDLDGFFSDDPNAEQETQSLVVTARSEIRFSERFTQRFEVGAHWSDLLGTDPDTFFNNYRIDTRVQHLAAHSDIKVSDSDTLSLGLRREERHGENLDSFDQKVVIESFYIQNRWSIPDRFHLTIAVRDDNHSELDDELTWRLTAAAEAGRATRVHASVGTAFRAPDLNELYFPFAGDPNLAPETSRGFDLGVEQAWLDSRVVLDVTYFRIDFDDLIDFDLSSFRFNNVVEAESSGIEASLRFAPIPEVAISLSHTFNDTENLATKAPLARRPRNRSVLDLGFDPTAALSGQLTVISVDDRVDSSGLAMDDYRRVDLTVRYRLTRRFAPYLRIENLLDADYEEVPGFTTPGRVAAIGLRYSQ